jgi:pyridoxal biosynthesis lyase PdxS
LKLGAPYEVLKQIKDHGRLPVVNFAAGGVATPQDAALMRLTSELTFLICLTASTMLPVPGSPLVRNIAAPSPSEVSRLVVMNDDEIMTYAKELGAPYEVLKQIKDHGRSIALANFSGSSDLKIPEPTNTPSAPNSIIKAASW